MIHLDTNYLIGLAVAGSPEAQRVEQWLASGEAVAASALAWTEFLNGPVESHEITLVESVIGWDQSCQPGTNPCCPAL
jgi:predicted nucleic acid-binding protein